MSTPEDEIRFAEAFNELGEAAELMVEPRDVADIRGTVRRRRATRVTVAAVAAIALVAPASWMLQQAATAEEREQPVVADDTTTETTAETEPVRPQEPTPTTELTPDAGTKETEAPPLLSFDDLVGTTFDLPSFMPDAPMVDSACVTDGAVLRDGTERGAENETGRINLLEVVHAPLTEGGHVQNIAFLGCRFAEASAFQAVVIELDGDDNWIAETQLIASKSNADSPYDIAVADGHGVLIGIAEHYACCAMDPDEFVYWVERARLDGDGEVLTERVDDGGLTNVSLSVESTGTNAEGLTEITVRVRNEGDVTSPGFLLSACGDPNEIATDFTVRDCFDGGDVVESIGPLAPGEEHSTSWEFDVAPSDEWTDGAHVTFTIAPDTSGDAGIARDLEFADNSGYYEFTE